MKASYKEKSFKGVLFVLYKGSTNLYIWTSPLEETNYAVNFCRNKYSIKSQEVCPGLSDQHNSVLYCLISL